jgi:hypothetical protein
MCDVAIFLHHGSNGNSAFSTQAVVREINMGDLSVWLRKWRSQFGMEQNRLTVNEIDIALAPFGPTPW